MKKQPFSSGARNRLAHLAVHFPGFMLANPHELPKFQVCESVGLGENHI